MEIADTFRDAGAEIVGPATSVDEALQLLENETVTAAVVDVNLGGDTSLPVAVRLEAGHLPFVYHTGQPGICGPAAWPKAPIVCKPALASTVVAVIADAVGKV